MEQDRKKGLTVRQLMAACRNEIAKGNGDRHILISSDDEGNSFHELWYLFSHLSGKDIRSQLPYGVDENEFDREYTILG